jgi:hypothetical protein
MPQTLQLCKYAIRLHFNINKLVTYKSSYPIRSWKSESTDTLYRKGYCSPFPKLTRHYFVNIVVYCKHLIMSLNSFRSAL